MIILEEAESRGSGFGFPEFAKSRFLDTIALCANSGLKTARAVCTLQSASPHVDARPYGKN